MTIATSPPAVVRWLTLASASGAVLALALEYVGVSGPWRTAALLLAAMTALCVLVMVIALRSRDAEINSRLLRAERGHTEIETLQREIRHHQELEQQLQKAKQAAEAGMLAKGEFLATMSHEIRTPLNGIVPMLDLLLTSPLPSGQRDLVRTAYASSQQLLRIVDDILDYSKLEADRLVLENTVFNLRELLEDVVQWMRHPADMKGLRLNLEIDASVRLPVRGDPVRLRQVLGNLIGNAVKFTDRGTIAITVRRLGENSSQHLLRFEVRDTGIGITPEAQAKLFTAFAQADASTTRLYGGTGLGLAICKRIVDLMGGRIGVVSEAGNGASFHFEIPLMKVQGDLEHRPVERAGTRVLLLSTDERLRRRLLMLLPNWGLRLTAVDTVHEALERLRTAAAQGEPWRYAVVLADLAGIRNTSVALQRNLQRQSLYGEVQLVCLFGDEGIPDGLQRNDTVLLPRLAPDNDLRAALMAPGSVAVSTAPSAAPHRPEPAPAVERRRWHGRLLLVEDNPVNLLVAQQLLKVLGLECDTATNGELALQAMARASYDVVLMDCQMPVIDGYTATRRWRQHETALGTSRLPIVAMTANAMAGDRQKCLDAGMDDYLAKPVTRAQLDACLARWLPLPDERHDHAPATASIGTINAAMAADTRQDASVQSPEMPMLNEETLDDLEAMIGAGVVPIIGAFLDNTPRLIAQLKSAAEVPDLPLLRELAHSLKSSSANLGADALSEAAKRIELDAREQTLERPAAAVAVVVAEYERVRPALLARMPATAQRA
ncbi:signal transduction histidine kinase [Luteimonas cucumeris]|uniref:histidine kinase n=1 Tax=Luteimonas cucumeris TaxID=985012 RepID=A0A562LEM0_9GAMM|nr:hybrid sensor histidine kinase/response regulator [Luteimonas cucumeris]TWI06066.1 signal transduction histidine kinase [Luteimonas cucumeris]